MKTNVKTAPAKVTTHEGAPGTKFSALLELKRTVATCLLFEPTFYEKGSDIAMRIADLCSKVKFDDIADTALWCRNTLNLRHVSLFLTVLAMHKDADGSKKRSLVKNVVVRADELGEIINLYWLVNGRKAGQTERPALPNAMKKGLADAFDKFDEYQLAKWNTNSAAVKVRDVMFLVHPKPAGTERAELYARIASDSMATPETWETKLSAGQDKNETFTNLMKADKLGAMALLRNLRNMVQSGVDRDVVRAALNKADWTKVLPFRFLSAAKEAPEFFDALDKAFLKSCAGVPKMSGDALIMIDVSGSMGYGGISQKSNVTPAKAAFALAAVAKEIFDDSIVYGYDDKLHGPFVGRGLALTKQKTPGGGTFPGRCLEAAHVANHGRIFDWVIIITDEQSHDKVLNKKYGNNQLVINVQPYEVGLKLDGSWIRVNGWSERIFDFLKVSQDLEAK